MYTPPKNPRSAGAFIWAALILNVLAVTVPADEVQFVFSALAALLVLVPSILYRDKAALGARFILVLSLGLAYAGYPKFIDSPYMQRARAVQESGARSIHENN
jgi:hypothetical protein